MPPKQLRHYPCYWCVCLGGPDRCEIMFKTGKNECLSKMQKPKKAAPQEAQKGLFRVFRGLNIALLSDP